MLPPRTTIPSHATSTAPAGAAECEANLPLGAPALEGQDLPSPVPLMTLSTGFWAFKTLAAAHELGLFSRLANGRSTTAAELAEALRIELRPADMLLTGCAALGLLDKTAGRYRNASISEAYLVPGRPQYFGGFIEMADKRLYAGWGKLVEALRTNRPTTWDPTVQTSVANIRRLNSTRVMRRLRSFHL